MPRPKKQEVLLLLPYPPGVLMPNAVRRTHWGKRASATADVRERTAFEARRQVEGGGYRLPMEYVDLTIQWFAPDMRFGDRDGLLGASKAILDGLQPPSDKPGAGIIRDDSDKGVRKIVLLPTEVDKQHPRTEVLIREA